MLKYIIFLIIFLISCIASNTGNDSVYGYTEKYIDGCYYIITDKGGITAKVNQPDSCTE